MYYCKIGESSYSAEIVVQMLFRESAGRLLKLQHWFPGEKPLTCHTFTRSRANLIGPLRNTFIVYCLFVSLFHWNQSEAALFQGSPELFPPWPTCAKEFWGRDCTSSWCSKLSSVMWQIVNIHLKNGVTTNNKRYLVVFTLINFM